MNELELLMWSRRLLANGQAAEIRRHAGLSQEELARAVPCSAAAICLYESGKRRPRGERARRYAELLQMMHAANELGIDVRPPVRSEGS